MPSAAPSTTSGWSGGQFVPHPNKFKSYLAILTALGRADPIMAAFSDFDVATEQYYMLVDPSKEVLANTTHHSTSAPWTNEEVMPVVWKNSTAPTRSSILRSFTPAPSSPPYPTSSKLLFAPWLGPPAGPQSSASLDGYHPPGCESAESDRPR